MDLLNGAEARACEINEAEIPRGGWRMRCLWVAVTKLCPNQIQIKPLTHAEV